MIDSAKTEGTLGDSRTSPVGWLTLSVPMLIAIAVSLLSPNFTTGPAAERDAPVEFEVRDGSLGGDFLQEFVGGQVIHSENWALLYDLDYVKSRQHDAAWLGFSWPDDDYFPMVYPPYYYWLTGLFASISSWLGYLWTARLWLWLNGAAVMVSAVLLNRFYPACRELLGPSCWALVVFTPLLHNFNLGQKGGLLLLIVTATFLLLHHGRWGWGGLVFGLIAFKPHLGVVVGLTMLFKRQWWFCAGALGMVAVQVLVSHFAFPGLWSDYLEVVGSMQGYVRTAGYQLASSQSLWGAAELTLGSLSPWFANAVAVMLGGVVVFLLVRATDSTIAREAPGFGCQFAAMLLATVLLSPHFYLYDLTLVLLAMLVIATEYPVGMRFPAEPASSNSHAASRKMSWRSTRQGTLLLYLMLSWFLLAGLFPKIANTIYLQPGVLVLMGILWLLGSMKGTRWRELAA